MRKARIPVALAAFLAASSASGATPPQPGRYTADIVVTEVHGAECLDQTGDKYHGVLVYGGINATKATLRKPVLVDKVHLIEHLTLTITSGIGTLSPSGTFSLEVASPLDLKVSGTFEAKLIFSDAEAFTERLTVMAPSVDCTEAFDIALVRSG
jgi:hypothetical protein